MPKKMNKNFKPKWLAALRSGQYEQGKGSLRTVDNKFCCLGVACDLLDPKKWHAPKTYEEEALLERNTYLYGNEECLLNNWTTNRLGLTQDIQETLAQMNDGEDTESIAPKTFLEIADWIEENL